MKGANIVLVSIAVVVLSPYCEGKKYDPCCSFPCQNRGVCLATKNYEDYTCNCEGTGLSYHGKNCEISTWGQWFKNLFTPSPWMETFLLTHGQIFWWIIDTYPFTPIKRFLMSTVIMDKTSYVESPPLYATDGRAYTVLDAARNMSYSSRSLPEVPKDCPKPLGTYGKERLPDLDVVVEKLFKRKEFIPDKVGTSLLFAFMAQHFTHQYFKTDFSRGPNYAYGTQSNDASHIYGDHTDRENLLRSHKDGKMKMQTLNGEEYPPYLEDVGFNITLPDGFEVGKGVKLFALGHDFFPLFPGLILYSTIFLREHNRICDILKEEHPQWDDERLFQTAKLIVLGLSVKLIVEDYLHAVSNFYLKVDFDPTLLHGTTFNFANRMFVEHNHLYHWHQMMPDEFNIDGDIIDMEHFIKYNSEVVVKYGTQKLAQSLSKQVAGMLTLLNHGNSTMEIARRAVKHGRELKLQPYNQYRKRFGHKAWESMDDITSNKEHRRLLKELYGDDVDGIEFFVGAMAEERRYEGVFGPVMYDMVGPYSLKGLFSTPICAPQFWRASTFGGETGFNIIKNTNLEDFFCRNMPGECGYISFRVPGKNPESNLPVKEEL